jgi:hypothetical protein
MTEARACGDLTPPLSSVLKNPLPLGLNANVFRLSLPL